MEESYVALPERARKNHTLILQRLASVGQVNVAKLLSVSESEISRFKSKDLDVVAQILSALDLKVVPNTMKCYEPDAIGAILTMAKKYMDGIQNPEQLSWEE